MTVAAFLKRHIAAASNRYQISVVANASDPHMLSRQGLSAVLIPVAIRRQVSPWADLKALVALYRVFRKSRFDAVHSVSPKAGLLAMLAGWLARVPIRIHTFTGQVWVSKRGIARLSLKALDRLMAGLATCVLVDAPTQLAFLREQGVLPPSKGLVIGDGSICGVDARRFSADEETRRAIRTDLKISGSSIVLLFLGRLTVDKGVLDLATAFSRLAPAHPQLQLLLVGPDEEGLMERVRSVCKVAANRVHHVGYTREPERFMAAADIFCLPSYREGFGMTAIESAAVGLPVVASRIYGVVDAVAENDTGLLHEPGNVAELLSALEFLIGNEQGRRAMGARGRARVVAKFSAERVTAELLAFYEKIFL